MRSDHRGSWEKGPDETVSSAVSLRVAYAETGMLSPQSRRERIAVYVLHRDRDVLERQGVLRTFRGGATPRPSGLFESNVHPRNARVPMEAAPL